ncbi:MAG: phosphodiesterase [Gammaproteobacteria bacterium]
MDSIRSVVFVLTFAMLASSAVSADVLLIDSIESAPAIPTPQRGLTMADVRQQYGNPVTEHPTVSANGGPYQPPITRWDYDDYSVFFENDTVIQSVVHHPANQ